MQGGWRLLLAAVLATAGCLGGGAPGDEGGATNTTTDDGGAGNDGADGGSAGDGAGLGESTDATWYLLKDLNVVRNESLLGEPGRVMLDPVSDGFLQGELTRFTTSNGGDMAVVMTRGVLTLQYTRDTPGVRDQQFPYFGAFWGVTGGTSILGLTEGPATIMAGDVVEAVIEYEVPPGGLVFPPGAGVWLTIFGAYHPTDDGSSAGYLVVEDPAALTRFEGTYHLAALPPAREVEALSEAGSLQGGECNGLSGEASRATHVFEVGPDVVGVEAEVVRTGGQGANPDIDLDILGPGGEVVGGGHTPYAEETASAYLPNIGAAGTGTWSVQVRACTPQTAEYAVTVKTLVREGADDAAEDSAS